MPARSTEPPDRHRLQQARAIRRRLQACLADLDAIESGKAAIHVSMALDFLDRELTTGASPGFEPPHPN